MTLPPEKILFVSTGERAIHRVELSANRDNKKAGHFIYEYVSMDGVADHRYLKKGKTVPVTLSQLQQLMSVHLLEAI
jgi:hypothetical protein